MPSIEQSSLRVRVIALVSAVLRALRGRETLVRYFVFGALASALDVALFLVLHNLAGFGVAPSQLISVATSVIASFVLNARHNFRTFDYIPFRLFSFGAIAFLGFLLGLAIIVIFDRVFADPNLGKIISLPFVFIFQYLMNSRVTFRRFRAQHGGVSGGGA